MSRLEDAYERLTAAQQRLHHRDFVGAIMDAQLSLERSLKATLDTFRIEYRDDRGRLLHDVSSKAPQLFQNLRKSLHARDVERIRSNIGKVAVCNHILTSVKDYAQYGMKDLGLAAKEIFASILGEPFARLAVAWAKKAYNLANEIERESVLQLYS